MNVKVFLFAWEMLVIVSNVGPAKTLEKLVESVKVNGQKLVSCIKMKRFFTHCNRLWATTVLYCRKCNHSSWNWVGSQFMLPLSLSLLLLYTVLYYHYYCVFGCKLNYAVSSFCWNNETKQNRMQFPLSVVSLRTWSLLLNGWKKVIHNIPPKKCGCNFLW